MNGGRSPRPVALILTITGEIRHRTHGLGKEMSIAYTERGGAGHVRDHRGHCLSAYWTKTPPDGEAVRGGVEPVDRTDRMRL